MNVIGRKFDAQEARNRYRRNGPDVKNDDGKSPLPEPDIMAYLEIPHIILHSFKSITVSAKEMNRSL